MRKIFVLSVVAFLGLSLSAQPVLAESGSSTVQRALESTKQFLDDLVTAKDENTGDDVNLRIQTFERVLDLSQAEAKDFEFKLLVVDKDVVLDSWKKAALLGLDQAIAFFSSERDLVSSTTATLDLAGIKQAASDFKTWRDKNYLPLVSQAQEFLLVKQEARAVQTAQSRLDKITKDLKNLNRPKVSGSADIGKLLDGSKTQIAEAAALNSQAYDAFVKEYAETALSASSSTDEAGGEASSTEGALQATSSPTVSAVPVSTSTGASGATAEATSSTATSSAAAGLPNSLIVSIKDLVRSSLDKIKGAYQGFIDISNLVRKLL